MFEGGIGLNANVRCFSQSQGLVMAAFVPHIFGPVRDDWSVLIDFGC